MSKKQFEQVYTFFGGDELRANVLIDKYLLRDKEGNFLEHSAEEVISRVCKVLSKTTDNPKHWYKEFKRAVNNFKGVVPQGSILSAAGNKEFLQSLSNCFVTYCPDDSMASIFKAALQEATVMKHRGGDGIDLSKLRPCGATVANAAGTSSGTIGFADFFSNVCKTIAQSGRRGALMLTLDIKHPDALEWARMKQDLTKVTGANVSLKLSDEFMIAVKNKDKFTQQWPIDSDNPKIKQEVDAYKLWTEICKCAHASGEPGILMWDNITNMLPAHCYKKFKTVSTNPCITNDTWILTSTGHKQVKDLIGIPFKAVVDGKLYQSLGFFKTGTREVYKVTTNKGFELELTNNHKLQKCDKISRYYKNTEWAELKYLSPGDSICLNSSRNHFWEGSGNYSQGWLVGNFKGDGTSAENSIYLDYWGQTKSYMKAHALSCLVNGGITIRSDCGSGAEGGKEKLRLGSTELYKFVSQFSNQDIKDFNCLIEKTSSEFYKGFIQGWFDADGTVIGDQKKGISVRLASNDLKGLKLVQRMLISLGIISTIYTDRKVEGYYELPDGYGGVRLYHCKTMHELVITKDNVIEFYKKINFKDPEKEEKLYSLIKKYKRKPNRERFIDKIKTIEKIGTKEVFDCSVNDIQCFSANGILAHNCSEIALSSFDSCRLTSICLTNYVCNKFQYDAYFDFELFEKDVRVAMRMLDAVIDVEIEHIDNILKKVTKERKTYTQDRHELDFEIELWENIKDAAKAGRRTGLGTHGLADCLAQLGVKYDTDKALWMVDRIYGSLCHNAYDESVNMAIEKGPFPVWEWEVEKDCPFFSHFPDWLLSKMKKHGRRNISILTNAPTGSISMLSGCSSGIEPTFRLCYTRRRKINANDINSTVDFIDQDGDRWHNYPVFDKNVQSYFDIINSEFPNVLTDEGLMEYLPEYFITSDKINWRKRIELQALIQKYIDHSISSTVNLPKDTSVLTVKNLYTYAWEKGLKGVTIYRDGSRSGVLIENEINRPHAIVRQEAPSRPEYLPCEIHPVTVQGEEYIVIVGLMGASVYEVFAGRHCNNIAHKKNIGQVRKVGRKKYILLLEQDGEELEIDINKYFENPQYSAITRLVSTSLRHGTPLEFIITQLQKSSEALAGFEKCLARVLKKYVSQEDLAKTIKYCEKCESTNIEVRFVDGCSSVICHSCNTVDSKCS